MVLAQVQVQLGLGHQVAGGLIHRARVLDVEAGKLALEDGQLVVDGVGPGHDVVLGHAFERAEEPRPVLFYGPANRPPVLLPVEGRFDAGPAILHLGEVVDRHEIVVTEVAEDRPAVLVRSGLGRQQDGDRAAPVFGGRAARHDLELLDPFQGVGQKGPAVVVFLVVQAVDEHVVVLPGAAAKRHVVGGLTVRGDGHLHLAGAWQQVHHRGQAAIEHGELRDFSLANRRGQNRLRGFDERNGSRHRQVLLDARDRHLKVDRQGGPRQ
ncbi:MAG: hypothetical protein DMF89_04770 [Acidobacteria bacterium]|nr:MAG: hypothetical protein DMF89_04770 [Acidobacteriota bacterium]